MTLVTGAVFAQIHGVSAVSVHRWKKRGWLVFEGKQINVEASNARLAMYRDQSDARATRDAKPAPPRATPQAPAPPLPVLPPPPSAFDPEVGEDLANGRATTEEARRVKENYLALRGKLEYEQAAGSLVDIARAEAVLFEAARAVRNAWLGWPSKYAALIAADLGLDADRVTTVLTPYVHKQIAQLGEPDADFAG